MFPKNSVLRCTVIHWTVRTRIHIQYWPYNFAYSKSHWIWINSSEQIMIPRRGHKQNTIISMRDDRPVMGCITAHRNFRFYGWKNKNGNRQIGQQQSNNKKQWNQRWWWCRTKSLKWEDEHRNFCSIITLLFDHYIELFIYVILWLFCIFVLLFSRFGTVGWRWCSSDHPICCKSRYTYIFIHHTYKWSGGFYYRRPI